IRGEEGCQSLRGSSSTYPGTLANEVAGGRAKDVADKQRLEQVADAVLNGDA
ncbi:hypothetical protein L7F22_038506, partial [Adiantum nelumboides]|nr:hypothetical protein [Adiantum nelumboides]